MSEKMCGALFNILGDIEGLTVLDAFSGSGALSFEAVSRGAKEVTSIESDYGAYRTIACNIAKLGLETGIVLIHATNMHWSQTNEDTAYDIILCDPPYDDRQSDSIRMLAGHVKSGGLLVLSWPSNEDPIVIPELRQIEQRTYGNAQLIFYRA